MTHVSWAIHTHKDLVENFDIALKDVDMTKVLQLSMSGPKVNLKFLEEIQKGRRLEQMQEVIDRYMQPSHSPWCLGDWCRKKWLGSEKAFERCISYLSFDSC